MSRSVAETKTDAGEIHVGHVLNTLGQGGAEVLTLELIRHTTDEDIRYTVYHLGTDTTLASEFEETGADIVNLRSRTSKPQYDPFVLPKLLQVLVDDNPDILHAHMPYVQVVSRLAGGLSKRIDVVSTYHTLQQNLPAISRYPVSITRFLDSTTVTVCDGVRDSFDSTVPFVPQTWHGGKCRTIYNGIDVEQFNGRMQKLDDRPSRIDVDDRDGIRFVNIGRFVLEKSQRTLLEAMERVRTELPDSHLYVVGSSGDLEGDLREQKRQMGLDDSVSIVHHANDEFDIHEYYTAADVFVSSSIVEGLPMTLLEAMAAELPVVATDIPGVREVVEDGTNGELVAPRSPQALADAMVSFASETKRRRFGHNGFERVKRRFTIEETIDAYTDLYRTLSSNGTIRSWQ